MPNLAHNKKRIVPKTNKETMAPLKMQKITKKIQKIKISKAQSQYQKEAYLAEIHPKDVLSEFNLNNLIKPKDGNTVDHSEIQSSFNPFQKRNIFAEFLSSSQRATEIYEQVDMHLPIQRMNAQIFMNQRNKTLYL